MGPLCRAGHVYLRTALSKHGSIQLIPLMDDITVDLLDNSKKSGPGVREAMTS